MENRERQENGESYASQAANGEINDRDYIYGSYRATMHARANRHVDFKTGIPELDKLLGGGYGEGLHVLAGIPGVGKTSLALSIALHNALEGRPVLYATFEQSKYELWNRLNARLTGVPYGALKRGTYNRHGTDVPAWDELTGSEGWAQVDKAVNMMRIAEAGDALSRTQSPDDLAGSAAAMAEAFGTPPLIVIDYLQRMPAEGGDTRERVSSVSGVLQVKLARDLGCPVLAISSLNRNGYKLAELDLEGKLAALKESGDVEYSAYTITFVYGLPPGDWGVDFAPGVMLNPMVLDVAKHREGRPGQLKVKWQPVKNTWHGAQAYGEGPR